MRDQRGGKMEHAGTLGDPPLLGVQLTGTADLHDICKSNEMLGEQRGVTLERIPLLLLLGDSQSTSKK